MVKNDRINLIEEITSQKGNDFVILTTFNFDPFFFDTYLFQKLQEQNRTAELVILIDEKQYEFAYPNFTNITGISYHLVPIRIPNGVFHPKFFFFVSKKFITVYYGSANLTLPGFTANAEIITNNIIERKNGLTKDILVIRDLFQSFIENKIITDEDSIEVLKNLIGVIEDDSRSKDGIEILHNYNESILDQVFRLILERDFEEMFVLAPFISEDERLVRTIFERLKIKRLVLGLQQGNHNLENISKIEQACKNYNVDLVIKEVDFFEKTLENDELVIPRRFHSKIIHFKGNSSYLLLGSPNFTHAALKDTIKTGNFELGVFIKNPGSELFENIKLKEVKQITNLLANRRESNISNELPVIIIHNVKFLVDERKLIIKTEPLNKKITVKIKSKENPFEPLIISHNFQGGILETILEKKPYEVEFIDGTRTTKRRIFDDSDPLRRLFRSGFSMKKLISQSGGILNLDFNSLIDILKIVTTISERKTTTIEKISIDSEKEFLPSTTKTYGHFHGTLDYLSKLINPILEDRQKRQEIEDLGGEEDIEEQEYTHSYENRSRIENSIKKTLKNLYGILLTYNQKTENENFVDSIVFYISTFLQLAPRLSESDKQTFHVTNYQKNEAKYEIIELFESKLDELFDITPDKDTLGSNYKNLLLAAICLNISSNVLISNTKFYRCIFFYDFLNKSNYYELRNESEKYFVKNSQYFSYDIFNKTMSIFAFRRFKGSMFEMFLINLCKTMEQETDLIFLSYLKSILETVYTNYSIESFRNLKYNKNTPGGAAIHQIINMKKINKIT